MSYSRAPRGSRSSGKGASKDKRVRRQKQDYHKRKQHAANTEQVDVAELKSRTVIALNHLGGQTLSTDPGGYGLEGWVKSLNVLLDDFQGKVGDDSLPSDFARKRQEVVDGTLASPNTDDLDSKIAQLRAEVKKSIGASEGAKKEKSQAVADLKARRLAKTKELEEASRRQKIAASEQRPRSFLDRLLGRSGAPSTTADGQVEHLRAELQKLDAQIRLLESPSAEVPASSMSVDGGGSPDSRLAELETKREQVLQMSEQRQRVCASLAELVSSVHSGPEPASGS